MFSPLTLASTQVHVACVNSLPQSSTRDVTMMKNSPVSLHEFKPSHYTALESGDDPDRVPLQDKKTPLTRGSVARAPIDASLKLFNEQDSNIWNHCPCGQINKNRIVNGWEVKPKHRFPWHVGLKENNSLNYICGGSIINNLYILTGAHCVTNKYEVFLPSILTVGIGDHLSTLDDDETMLAVEKIIVHEDFNPDILDNDIALLKLSTPINLGSDSKVGTICLPSNADKSYSHTLGIAPGWGAIDDSGTQLDFLQEMVFPILDSDCMGYSKYVTENQFCVDPTYGDTCRGDSGGALMVDEGNHYTQVGITSYTFSNCNDKYPTVFTKVSNYFQWIKDNTKDAQFC
ncbi:hypothetical protein Pcinc_020527 [Petrolisthes cinctipes]|uniref:Peptidase S1 domain-containing protein n=1 Tax=Petrolisthes cinctipes TaxID=88211 RepID=A0AAE1KJT4_PETCI|nr:hypothetical protein Pcinc_020527 [Petrolisthes cinctipes]